MIGLLTALSLLAHATRVEATTVPCPLDTGDARVHRLVAAAPVGGWDSDGASYARGGQFRAFEVSTCPSGLSMYGADLALGLPPSLAARVRPILEAHRTEARAAGTTPPELPAWQRHRHAARVYEALDRDAEAAQLRLSAAWLARDRAVGLFEGLPGPVAVHTLLAAAPAELEKPLTDATRKQLLFNLVVVAHRGGHPDVRDAYLARVRALELAPAEAARIQAFEEAVALEQRLLAEALPAWRAQAETAEGAARWLATYHLAEILRRLGRPEQARPLYAAVSEAEGASSAVRALAAYFDAALGGGTPWEAEDASALTRPPPFVR